MTKRIVVPALIGAALLMASIPAIAFLISTPSEASAHKNEVCHYRVDTNTYKKLHLGSANAMNKHVANHQYDINPVDGTNDTGDALPDNGGNCPTPPVLP